MTLKISNTAAQAAAVAVTVLLDADSPSPAVVEIYAAGTPGAGYTDGVPDEVDLPITDQTLLAELVMSDPSFDAPYDNMPGGSVDANAIADDTMADATGDAVFFRIRTDGGTYIIQGSVTATGDGGDLQLNTVSIQANALVSITSLKVTMPEG